MTAPDFEDQPPQTDRLSAYDERHLVTYLRLLNAEKDGAHWEEAVLYRSHKGARARKAGLRWPPRPCQMDDRERIPSPARQPHELSSGQSISPGQSIVLVSLITRH